MENGVFSFKDFPACHAQFLVWLPGDWEIKINVKTSLFDKGDEECKPMQVLFFF